MDLAGAGIVVVEVPAEARERRMVPVAAVHTEAEDCKAAVVPHIVVAVVLRIEDHKAVAALHIGAVQAVHTEAAVVLRIGEHMVAARVLDMFVVQAARIAAAGEPHTVVPHIAAAGEPRIAAAGEPHTAGVHTAAVAEPHTVEPQIEGLPLNSHHIQGRISPRLRFHGYRIYIS